MIWTACRTVPAKKNRTDRPAGCPKDLKSHMPTTQNLKYITLFLLILPFQACNSQTKKGTKDQATAHKYTNQLINSSSPYLLQHAHNPVNWYPWGEEALKKAKEEDKLLIISVGYAACHWCHVMEHESFEDTAVARLMNEHFVSIKVDREERPDIDQIYMNAAQMTSGRGGWPLNAIAMPDGRPLFGATYFPKEGWLKMLNYFIQLRENEPEKLEEAATQLTEGIQQMDFTEINPHKTSFQAEILPSLGQTLLKSMDLRKGGLSKAPKFPMPAIHQWLLRNYALTGDETMLQAATVSLDEMAAGGIYDQIGGGFARYSTDAIWKVPHFEKMLYDNAQLVSLYSEAYLLTGEERYKEVVYETLAFIEREMSSNEGGFYSSLDADSEGEEGKFYVWSAQEIELALGEDADCFKDYFNVAEEGNWEGKNILFRTLALDEVARKHNLSSNELKDRLEKSKKKLLAIRSTRIRPGLDDKILTAWNALMLKGYADAYRAFGEQKYLDKALANAVFLKKNMRRKDGGLNRNFKDGKSSINAFSDDYGFTIEAFITLYQLTFDENWLFEAQELMEYALQHFFDEKTGMFFYTSDEDAALITRTKEVADKVIPAANSSLAKGLYLLGTYLYQEDYLAKSEQMLNNVFADLSEQPAYYTNWAMLLNWFTHKPYEVAIVGENCEALRTQLNSHFLPNAFLLGGKSEGKLELLKNKLVKGETYIYVCQDKACKFPVQEIPEALKLMK